MTAPGSAAPLTPLPLDALLEAFSTTVEAGDGVARLAMRRTDTTVGGFRGSINGGVLAALVELAAHSALATVLTPGEAVEHTIDVSVTYLRPSLGDPTLAEGRLLRKGGRYAVCIVEVRNGESGDVTVIGKATLGLLRQSDG
ncbi:MAG: PaaI family thioesterase [Dehalococcoidia bacterium]|nr:PaaI family thioesterase [Dehalococcoidia bacterium]